MSQHPDDLGHFVYPGGRIEIPSALCGANRPDRVLLTGAYCSHGHNLIRPENEHFDGLPGIALRATDGALSGTLTLSPFQGDSRKVGPSFRPGAILSLSCPTCETPLEPLEDCDCDDGGGYVALYTVRSPHADYCVGVCRRWGCFQSFLRDAGRLIVAFRNRPPSP